MEIIQSIKDVESSGWCAASWQPKVVALAAPLILSLVCGQAFAMKITCTFDVNDFKQHIDIKSGTDIYSVNKIELPGGFRFAGQYLPDMGKFKAYVYHTPIDRLVLLASQDFKISPQTCSQDFGQHRVYDASDERELFFHCIKTCDR